MSYEQLERAEPALVAGLFSAVAGFAALLAADFSTLHSAGVAVGMSASQSVLTRPAVYSPRTVGRITAGSPDSGMLLTDLFGTGAGSPRPDEPAVTVGVRVFLVAFLVQLFAGVDMTSALVSSAGIGGVQTLATRSRVYSPATTQLRAMLARLEDGVDDEVAAAEASQAPTEAKITLPGGKTIRFDM